MEILLQFMIILLQVNDVAIQRNTYKRWWVVQKKLYDFNNLILKPVPYLVRFLDKVNNNVCITVIDVSAISFNLLKNRAAEKEILVQLFFQVCPPVFPTKCGIFTRNTKN